jgi:hypothetical protein
MRRNLLLAHNATAGSRNTHSCNGTAPDALMGNSAKPRKIDTDLFGKTRFSTLRKRVPKFKKSHVYVSVDFLIYVHYRHI